MRYLKHQKQLFIAGCRDLQGKVSKDFTENRMVADTTDTSQRCRKTTSGEAEGRTDDGKGSVSVHKQGIWKEVPSKLHIEIDEET